MRDFLPFEIPMIDSTAYGKFLRGQSTAYVFPRSCIMTIETGLNPIRSNR